MIWIICSVFTLMGLVSCLLVWHGSYRANPVVLFSIVNWIMGVGILVKLDLSFGSDQIHAIVLCLTAGLFVIGSKIGMGDGNLHRRRYREYFNRGVIVDINSRVLSWLIFLIFFSLIVSVLYYRAIGYNVFLLSLDSVLSTGSAIDDLSTLRLQSYAGDQYFAPGYVNQFKNMILPVSCLILYIYASLVKSRKLKFFVFLLMPAVLVVLLGTGQRGAFVTVLLITLVSYSMVYSTRRINLGKNQRKYLVLSALGLALFLLITLVGGRAGDGGLVGAFEGLIHRIFSSNQIAAVYGFRYVESVDVVWGAEWGRSIIGLLPGVRGSDLNNVIFSHLFGGFRGTAPVSLWGSVWHNMGWLGVLAAPLFMGFIYARVLKRLLMGDRGITRNVIFGGVVVVLSIWVAGNVTFLFNAGLAALVFMSFSCRVVRKFRF